jgi:large subunit ribosomal protein L28e
LLKKINKKKEASNLKGKNSFRFNGLVHNRTVGVVPSDDKKGIVLTTKKHSYRNKPGKNSNKVVFLNSSGPRRVLSKIRTSLRSSRYRKDLKTAALRRASALLRAQQTKAVKPAGTAAVSTEKKSQQKS